VKSKVLTVIGVVALLVTGAYADQQYNQRFGIFYEQDVNSNYSIRVFHDALTMQEFVCVEYNTGGAYKASGISCHLTGRTWK
jgi:hypothetical protein